MTLIRRIEVIEFEYETENIVSHHGHVAHKLGSKHRARRIAVRLECDNGVIGEYVPLWSAPPMALRQILSFAPRMIGRHVGERERMWDDAHWHLRKGDRIGYGTLDIALWDALGKLTGQSISTLAGRFRDRLPTYATTLHGNPDDPTGLNTPASFGDYAKWCLAEKFRGFKVHGILGGEVNELIEIVEAVADAVGNKLPILVDASQRPQTWAEAYRLGQACDAAGVVWLEDPMRGNSVEGHRMLREKLKTPILLGELLRDFEGKMALATSGATDILRADPELDMGITGVLKTAHAAEAIGMDVEIHGAGPAARHCVAAIRNTNYYEMNSLHPRSGNPMLPPVFADDYSDQPDAIGKDGCVPVPDGPGLGVVYDWAFIDARTTARTAF